MENNPQEFHRYFQSQDILSAGQVAYPSTNSFSDIIFSVCNLYKFGQVGHCTADIQDTVLTTETSFAETVGDKGMLGNDEMSDW